MHPSIGKNIVPNMPLTPQLISSINMLHQEQQLHGIGYTNKEKDLKLLPRVSEGNGNFVNISSKETTPKMAQKPSQRRNLPDSDVPINTVAPSTSAPINTRVMTVQPPLTIDFNDHNGYFTTSSTSESQGDQGQYMIYKLL